MATIILTLTVADLDRTAHALLMSKVAYLLDSMPKTGEAWKEAHRNIDALNDLYAQINAALLIADAA